MAFVLHHVVPWGRNLSEYLAMFSLSEQDLLEKKIASFGDGPASFNAQATKLGAQVQSFDPIYQFSREELRKRIDETKDIVAEQIQQNQENYRWDNIESPQALIQLRMSAMELFLSDFEQGKQEARYQFHELPNPLSVGEDTFDLGFSSHFLLLYPDLGLEFHIKAMEEMLRVCREIRIFPLVDLDAKHSKIASDIITYFENLFCVQIQTVAYEFQKGANQMLRITKS